MGKTKGMKGTDLPVFTSFETSKNPSGNNSFFYDYEV